MMQARQNGIWLKMAFDFDTAIDRSGTDSMRWDTYAGKDVLPLWVADMDFSAAPCILDALKERVAHGVLGYSHCPHQFNHLIAQHLYEQYSWSVDPDWIVVLPSVISGLYTAVRALTEFNQSVVIPQPIYHHLKLACTEASREFCEFSLQLEEGRWVYPKDLGSSHAFMSAQYRPKLALFCNPQNPGSTVFTAEELMHFADFCLEQDVWICSDEIHAGLVLDENKTHIPIASLSKDISDRTVTLMSVNKTFNIPGIGLAWAVAENPALRKAMQTGLYQTISGPSALAYTATQAALKEGEPWRRELLRYLRGNRDLIESNLRGMESLSLSNLEGSYLAWIDCSKLLHSNPHQILLDAGLATSPGSQFGQPEFVRLNFGTQRSRLIQALSIIKSVCK